MVNYVKSYNKRTNWKTSKRNRFNKQ